MSRFAFLLAFATGTSLLWGCQTFRPTPPEDPPPPQPMEVPTVEGEEPAVEGAVAPGCSPFPIVEFIESETDFHLCRTTNPLGEIFGEGTVYSLKTDSVSISLAPGKDAQARQHEVVVAVANQGEADLQIRFVTGSGGGTIHAGELCLLVPPGQEATGLLISRSQSLVELPIDDLDWMSASILLQDDRIRVFNLHLDPDAPACERE
jgi:hypothetical protein